jgi:uncharacterized protein YbaA (DUF1428 family)
MITGSVEIKTTDGQSIGVPGKRWTLEAVPVVLETLHGITGLVSVTPEQQPTGRTPEAQWSAVDANNQTVQVMLWAEVPYEETVVAQAIAAAIAEGEGT